MLTSSPILCAICRYEAKSPFGIPKECSHIYCFNCIKPWLNQNNTCPQCRKPVSIINKYEGLEDQPIEVPVQFDAFSSPSSLESYSPHVNRFSPDESSLSFELQGQFLRAFLSPVDLTEMQHSPTCIVCSMNFCKAESEINLIGSRVHSIADHHQEIFNPSVRDNYSPMKWFDQLANVLAHLDEELKKIQLEMAETISSNRFEPPEPVKIYTRLFIFTAHKYLNTHSETDIDDPETDASFKICRYWLREYCKFLCDLCPNIREQWDRWYICERNSFREILQLSIRASFHLEP